MKNNDDIEKLFQESFEHFEVVPPADLKAEIDKKINFKQSNSRKAIWWFGSVIALVIVGSSFAFLNLAFDSEQVVSKNQDHESVVISTGKVNSIQDNIAESVNTTSAKSENVILMNRKQTKDNFDKKNENKATNQNESIDNSEVVKTPTKKITNYSSKNNHYPSRKETLVEKILSDPFVLKQENLTKEIESITNGNSNMATSSIDSKETHIEDIKRDIEVDSLKNSTNESSQAEIVQVSDSLVVNNSSISSVKKSRRIPLMISLVGGSYFSYNQISNSENKLKIREKDNFQAQVDVAYLLSKSNFSIQTGLNYRAGTEQFSFQELVLDSVFSGYMYNTQEIVESEYYIQYSNRFDTIQFTRLDTLSTSDLYTQNNRTEGRGVSVKTSAYSIPLLLRYSKQLNKSRFYLDVSAGMSFSFLKYQMVNKNSAYNANLTYSKTGMNAILKSHLRYQFSKIGVSFNTNFGYDLKPVQFMNQKRNRYLFDVGVGVHYQF